MIESVPRQTAFLGQRLRQAEVGNLGLAAARQQDITGLEVTVDNVHPVCLGDAVGHSLNQLGRPPRMPGNSRKLLVQAAAGDEFQLEER